MLLSLNSRSRVWEVLEDLESSVETARKLPKIGICGMTLQRTDYVARVPRSLEATPQFSLQYAVHERHQDGYYGTLTEDSLQVSNTLALHKT